MDNKPKAKKQPPNKKPVSDNMPDTPIKANFAAFDSSDFSFTKPIYPLPPPEDIEDLAEIKTEPEISPKPKPKSEPVPEPLSEPEPPPVSLPTSFLLPETSVASQAYRMSAKKTPVFGWRFLSVMLLLLFVISIAANVLLGITYVLDQKKLAAMSILPAPAPVSQVNNNILAFEKLFITDVLDTEGDVSYQNRLDLETAAQNTQNVAIINGWETFLNSATQTDAQNNARALLMLFADNMQSSN